MTIEISTMIASLAFGAPGLQEMIIILVLMGIGGTIVGVVPFWFIFKRIGMSPWLSLIGLIPLVILTLPFIVAFCRWPAVDQRYQHDPQRRL